jgi:hypothetical protein
MLTQMLGWGGGGGLGFPTKSHVTKKRGFYPLAFFINVRLHASLNIALRAFQRIVAHDFFGMPIISTSSTLIPNLALNADCVFSGSKEGFFPHDCSWLPRH